MSGSTVTTTNLTGTIGRDLTAGNAVDDALAYHHADRRQLGPQADVPDGAGVGDHATRAGLMTTAAKRGWGFGGGNWGLWSRPRRVDLQPTTHPRGGSSGAAREIRMNHLSLLVQHYLRRHSRELGRTVREVAPEALQQLSSYSWPGNIRELRGILKQALLRASGPVLLPAFLPETLTKTGKPPGSHQGRKSPVWRHGSSASGWGPTSAACMPMRTGS